MPRRETTRSSQILSAGPQASADWSAREQLSPPVEMQAEKLLREAGSPERAKHAIDEAAKANQPAGDQRWLVAQRLGFVAYRELAAASTPLVIPGSQRWWVTPQGQHWKAWNASGVLLDQEFDSVEDARRYITVR
jgi:hypothetical protein